MKNLNAEALKKQLECQCKHFSGLINKCCTIGVKYDDVIKANSLPCLQTGGECVSFELYTNEEVGKKIEEIEKDIESLKTSPS